MNNTDSLTLVAVACSPRTGKTTRAALAVALEAARGVSPRINTEMIDLAGKEIDGNLAAGLPLRPGQRDDFPPLAEKLARPEVAGIIIGSPVYYGSVTTLCKAFIDRLSVFHKSFSLRNKLGAALTVGGGRNGGQELAIQAIHTAMLYQDMLIVGGPEGHLGAMLWNIDRSDDIQRDPLGIETAKALGKRVAEVALWRKG